MRRVISVEVGQRIGRGVVVQAGLRVGEEGQTRPGALLRCDCGTLYSAQNKQLVPDGKGRINNTSCGCAKADHIRSVRGPGGIATRFQPEHGQTKHYLFNTWTLMLQRCENPDFHKYPRYGGRGIKVCERWHDVNLFIEDIERELGPRPDRHTLDRCDNDGNYEPGNVRWATPRQQAANKPRQGSSQYPGVHWASTKGSGTWLARVHLGSFATEEEAAEAYQRAVEILEREGVLR